MDVNKAVVRDEDLLVEIEDKKDSRRVKKLRWPSCLKKELNLD